MTILGLVKLVLAVPCGLINSLFTGNFDSALSNDLRVLFFSTSRPLSSTKKAYALHWKMPESRELSHGIIGLAGKYHNYSSLLLHDRIIFFVDIIQWPGCSCNDKKWHLRHFADACPVQAPKSLCARQVSKLSVMIVIRISIRGIVLRR